MLSLILIVLISMSISALCSLFEACLLSMSHSDIANISLKNPHKASIWKTFKENLQKPIAVILIINTIAHTAGASLSGSKFDELYGPKWIILFSLIFSFAMIQWTEILPKAIGVKYNKAIANVIAIPLLFLIKIFTPVVKLIEFINKPFVMHDENSNDFDAVKELTVLSRFAFLNDVISKDQDEIISRTINLTDKKAKDIMIPIKDMKILSTKMSMVDALLEAHIHNHTRLPLIKDDNINDVIGYVNFKDIVGALKINPQNPSLFGISRPILNLKEDHNYSTIFKKITQGHQHIAVVKNDNNEVTGLITLEDVIEEIIGDVEDEHDILPTHCYPIAHKRFIIGGGCLIKRVNEEMQIDLPDSEVSVNEWMIKQFGESLRAGDSYKYGETELIIKKMSRSRIFELIIEKK